MFKEIEIKGYRGLKNIKLKDLERINVLIGENNSGKTSVLEAIQLFSSKNVIENAIAIARKREVQFAMPIGLRLMPYDMLLYSFPIDKQEIKEIDISGYRDEVGVQYGRAVTLIEMEDCGLVPVSIFGDGLKKVLTLASAAVKTRGGILLIDEFETGIHKHALIYLMKNYLIIVEGAHDIAVVEKLLKLNGINKRITSVEKVPKV